MNERERKREEETRYPLHIHMPVKQKAHFPANQELCLDLQFQTPHGADVGLRVVSLPAFTGADPRRPTHSLI